jgi:integrase
MFKSEADTPMNPNNVLNRVILPALNKCALCAKERLKHTGTDHDYIRDRSRPEWRGWHAFRRGLGTNLAELGVDDLTIQHMLRHANVATTRQHYIKVRNPKIEAAMLMLESASPTDCELDGPCEAKSVLN